MMHRSIPVSLSSRQVLRASSPSLRRAYPGIKQEDPSLHPTGSNSEAAKSKGPLANSQPPSPHSTDQAKDPNQSETKSATAAKEQQQQQQSQQNAGQQQQRGISTSCVRAARTGEVGRQRTVAEMDEELRQRMSGHVGEGGEAGVEYENGEPVAMKRGVRKNMFRYI